MKIRVDYQGIVVEKEVDDRELRIRGSVYLKRIFEEEVLSDVMKSVYANSKKESLTPEEFKQKYPLPAVENKAQSLGMAFGMAFGMATVVKEGMTMNDVIDALNDKDEIKNIDQNEMKPFIEEANQVISSMSEEDKQKFNRIQTLLSKKKNIKPKELDAHKLMVHAFEGGIIVSLDEVFEKADIDPNTGKKGYPKVIEEDGDE